MKTLIVFIIIGLCFGFTDFFKVERNPLFELSNVERVCFVSAESYQNKSVEVVPCGDKFFNFCSLSVAKDNLDSFKKNIDGLQFYLNESTLEELVLQLNCQKVETSAIDGMTIYYGYTPYYQDSVYLDGKKVNIQIVLKEGKVVVGFPMILTGY